MSKDVVVDRKKGHYEKVVGNKMRHEQANSNVKAIRERVKTLSEQVKAGVTDLATVKLHLERVEEKLDATHRIMVSNFSFLGDIETRIETFKRLCVGNNVFSDDQYEDTWDDIKGIRNKGPEEVIEPGDSLRITFKGVDPETGEVRLEDENFPVRVGSGALFLEEHLLGRSVGEKSITFDHTYEDDYAAMPILSGKTLNFSVTISKVKAKKVMANVDVKAEDETNAVP
jgi:hypothetical protein